MISAPLKPQVRNIETRRLPERKPVTIALGFTNSTAVILCSDTQMTSDSGFKFEESKLLSAYEADNWCAFGVYAGSPNLAKAVQDALFEIFWKKYEYKKVPTREEFERHLQSVVSKACSRQRSPIQMLWAFSDPDIVRLYRVDSKTITAVAERECLGLGDSSLVRFLLDHLTWVRTGDAARAAAYIVGQAAKYVDGVGGEIEMWAIYPRGRWESLDPEKLKAPRVDPFIPKGTFPKQTIVRTLDDLKRGKKSSGG